MSSNPTSLSLSIVVATALCCVASVRNSSGAELVRDGTAVAVIVTPEKPLPVVQAAAEELQYHVRKASGAELRIVPESQRPQSGVCVLLGATEAAHAAGLAVSADSPNAFVIKSIGDVLYILGDDSDGPAFWILHGNRTRVGTLFAVYAFLEKQLGVRWLWPGDLGTVVPRAATIVVGDWPGELGKPPFIHARWREGGAYMAGPQGWASQEVRSRFLNEQGKWLRRHRFAMGLNMDMAHSYTDWWDRFDKDHPEYFNLLPDGNRRSDLLYHGGSKQLISMCVAEPGVWRQKVADWAARRNPQRPYIDASENDTPGKCVCDKCLAWDEPDSSSGVPFDQRVAVARERFGKGEREWAQALGSLSDRYARFYLAIQKEAQATDPQAVVMGYSYANYVTPPRNTKLNERIIIGIVPALMYPWTPEKQQRFREQWDGWAGAGARVFLRPNYTLDGHNLPIFFARKLGTDFAYAAAHGLVGTDFDSLTGQFSTQGPNLYMLARLHDDPSLTADAVLAEFCAAFGKAAGTVREYFAHWEQVSDAVTDEACKGAELHFSYFYRGADRIFTPAVMARGRALLEQAKAAAQGDAEAEARVAFLDCGLRNAELTLATQQSFLRNRDAGDFEGYAKALAALDEFRARIEGDFVANMAYLAWAEGRFWDRSLIRLMSTPGTRLPDPWQFKWDPKEEGVAAKWFAETAGASGWQEIGTNAAWEEQSVGKAWKVEHAGVDYDGIAWYRTTFAMPPGAGAQQVRLLFGAVDEACTVWVNGQKVLERPYPFQGNADSWREAFEIEGTGVVRSDRPNTLAVRVEDRAGAGGIWRPVWLAVSDAPAGEEQNLIGNAGLEQGEAGWLRSTMCGKFDFAIDRTECRNGQASARLTCTEVVAPGAQEAAEARAWARWYRTDVGVEDGKTHRFRVWVKTSKDFTGKVKVFLTGDKTGTRTGEMLNTQGLWRELIVDGFVPKANAAAIYLNVYDSTGTVWFDDAELVQQKP